jgi:hypothetical protein
MQDSGPKCDNTDCQLNFDGECDTTGYSNTGDDVCPDLTSSDSSSESSSQE